MVKQKAIRKIVGFIAMAVIIGAMAACNMGNMGNNNNQIVAGEPLFSISGKFNKTGGGEVLFKLTDTASSGRSAHSVTNESFAISGELADGDIIFRLTGTYDPATGSYIASSSSSLIRYSISGAFDRNGKSLGSIATLLVRNSTTSDDWTAFSYVVDEVAAVLITGTPTDVVQGGIPEEAQGWWIYSYDEYTNDDGITYWDNLNVLFSQWSIIVEMESTRSDGYYSKYREIDTYTVVEVENKGSYYDVIFGWPQYGGTDAQVRAAVQQFLTEYNLTAEEIDSLDLPQDAQETDLFYSIGIYDDDPEYSRYGHGYVHFLYTGDFSRNISNIWSDTFYLERYLMNLGTVTPVTYYVKFQLTFTDTSMTFAGYNISSSSLAEVKAATSIHDYDPEVFTR